MRAHISWTLGRRLVVFYIRYRESGNLQHVVSVVFHLLSGVPLWLGCLGVVALPLFSVFERGYDFETISWQQMLSFFCFLLRFSCLFTITPYVSHFCCACNCPWTCLCRLKTVPPVDSPTTISTLYYVNLISHLHIYFLLYNQPPDSFKYMSTRLKHAPISITCVDIAKIYFAPLAASHNWSTFLTCMDEYVRQ